MKTGPASQCVHAHRNPAVIRIGLRVGIGRLGRMRLLGLHKERGHGQECEKSETWKSVRAGHRGPTILIDLNAPAGEKLPWMEEFLPGWSAKIGFRITVKAWNNLSASTASLRSI